jgi:ABC-2 type transport system permease protein
MKMGAIYIMWLRQLKRYYRSKSRMIGALGQPLLFLLAFGFGFGPVFSKAGQGNYITFLVPGIVAMAVLFTSMFSGIEIIWDRQFGFLKETLVAPVSRFRIMLGRTLGGMTVAVAQGLVIILLSYLIGFRIPNLYSFFLLILFMCLIAVTFTALGTAIASCLDDFHGFQLIMNFLIMPLFFLSGALFPMEGLPKVLNVLVKINPLSYGVDGLRYALTGVSYHGFTIDLLVLSVITVVILGIGSYLFSKIQI